MESLHCYLDGGSMCEGMNYETSTQVFHASVRRLGGLDQILNLYLG